MSFKLDRQAILAEANVVRPIAYTFLGLTSALSLLRFYTRARILRHFGTDDAFMALAVLGFIAYAVLLLFSLKASDTFVTKGRFILKITELIAVARWTTAMFAFCVIMVKVSFAFFMARLYGPHDKWQRWTIWTSTGVICVLGFIYAVMAIATCSIGLGAGVSCPTQAAYKNILFTWSFLNTIIDLLFAGLSILLVSKLTIKGAAAVSTAALLILGTIGGIASALRCAVLLGWQSGDYTTDSLVIGRWSLLEAGLTISAACLATLRPLLRMLQGKAYDQNGNYNRNFQQTTAIGKSGNQGTFGGNDDIELEERHSASLLHRGQEKPGISRTVQLVHT